MPHAEKRGVMKKVPIEQALEELEGSKGFRPCVTSRVEVAATAGCFFEFPEDVDRRLVEALEARGVGRLYSHQREAWSVVRKGENVVVVTPTASGKTLCYNLPVIDELLNSPGRRALYVFPTKALAQDQRAELEDLVSFMGTGQRVYTYDGDTPADIRRKVRTEAEIVITNPDMLHTAILPHHTKWNRFFSALSFLVVDEMHAYRGVFGSHMVNVLRRLRRVCAHYGSRPQSILCSATIANPGELAEQLLENPVRVVANNGAPRGKKILFFVNPPVVQKELGLRASPTSMARKVASRFLRAGVTTIVFTTSRLNVEIVTKYLKDVFAKSGSGEADRVRGYRGGYLPNTRREIEKGLREGKILGVVSTNALELGVDIGSLEVCVMCGYPGSIASTWQQAGRAGRRRGLSCAVLIARSSPLDQFIVRHPDYFFGRSPEHARVNADNLSVLVSHIKCAAFELPFKSGEVFGGKDLETILDYLAEKRVLQRLGDSWYWAADAYPANEVSLRSIGEENFLVVDRSAGNRIIAEVDFESAPLTLYQGAIYMLESVPFQVEELDYANRKAYVSAVRAEYYTEAVLYTHLKILETFQSDVKGEEGAGYGYHEGEVHVAHHVAGFKKLKFYSSENLGYGEVKLPDQEMHTCAFWISVAPEAALRLGLMLPDLLEALSGTAYAMQHMAAFLLMCDTGDLRRVIGDPEKDWFAREGEGQRPGEECAGGEGVGCVDPVMFLYDARPGGVGLTGMLYEMRTNLVAGTLELIQGCPCGDGCPSCVGASAKLSEKAKENAVRLLRWMISGRD